MPKCCCVPKCDKEHAASGGGKRSIFMVPKNEELRKKWEENIPGGCKLKSFQSICEKHFAENDIVRECIQKDSDGNIIQRVRFRRHNNNFCSPFRTGSY